MVIEGQVSELLVYNIIGKACIIYEPPFCCKPLVSLSLAFPIQQVWEIFCYLVSAQFRMVLGNSGKCLEYSQ